ncbi:hypothetical protein E2986_13640 [Frieseomelitta varia]|uniref:Uncharacterized protein n=1 Tax=Frieseomelitta varia TaxID=561572 RepID=A0A833VZ13_9HYME|nr:hypothetical protein E2986_13640 [Frieseomelitta varia]
MRVQMHDDKTFTYESIQKPIKDDQQRESHRVYSFNDSETQLGLRPNLTRTYIWRVRVDRACTHAYNAITGKRRVTASAVRARGWQVNNSTLALMRENPPLRNKIQRYRNHSVLFAGDHEARKGARVFSRGRNSRGAIAEELDKSRYS